MVNKQQKMFNQSRNQINITKEYHILTGENFKIIMPTGCNRRLTLNTYP